MKAALSASRAASVLSFMTVNSQRVFTQAELSQALSVSPASLSGVLLALTEFGYLARHPVHKTFEIGPALVAAGQAAAMRHPVVEMARPAMVRLARLGAECVGVAFVGETQVILAIQGAPAVRARELRVGQHLPVLPPYGQVFHSWDEPVAARAWLENSVPHVTPEFGESWERTMRVNRGRGFVVGLESDEVAEVQSLIDETAERPGDAKLRRQLEELIPLQGRSPYALDEIDPDRAYSVNYVAAPIFNSDGRFVYALSVQGMGTVSGSDLMAIGEAVGRECRTLTRELGGTTPSWR